MATANNDTIEVLNDLIATCKDGVNGFKTAADAVKSPTVKAAFLSRVTTIEQAAFDLQGAVRRLGGDPTDTGHAAASLHRGWLNLKAAVGMNDEQEIIEETLHGEEEAVKHYRDALAKPLPADVRLIVEQQARGAAENLAAVRSLGTGTSSPRERMGTGTDARM